MLSQVFAQTGDTVSTIYVREAQTYTECGLRKMDWTYVTYVPKNSLFRGLCGYYLQPPPLKIVTNYLFLDYENVSAVNNGSLGIGVGTHWFRKKLLLEFGYQKGFGKGQNELGVAVHKTILFRRVHNGRVKLPILRVGAKLGWLYGAEGESPMYEIQLSTPTFLNRLTAYTAFAIEGDKELHPHVKGTFRIGLKHLMYGRSGTRKLRAYRYRILRPRP